jgi:hypothetical protein
MSDQPATGKTGKHKKCIICGTTPHLEGCPNSMPDEVDPVPASLHHKPGRFLGNKKKKKKQSAPRPAAVVAEHEDLEEDELELEPVILEDSDDSSIASSVASVDHRKPMLRAGERDTSIGGLTLQAWRKKVIKNLVKIFPSVSGYPVVQHLPFCGSVEGWIITELWGRWSLDEEVAAHNMHRLLSRLLSGIDANSSASVLASAERRFIAVIRNVRLLAATRTCPMMTCEQLSDLVEISGYETTWLTDTLVSKLSGGTITRGTRAVRTVSHFGLPRELEKKLLSHLSHSHQVQQKKKFHGKKKTYGKRKTSPS